jgi:hypothetical protein
MRTTITLSEAVFKAAKRRAAERGVTLSALIDEILRAQLGERAAARKPFQLVTFGTGGTHAGVDLDRTSELVAQDDAAIYGSKRDRS